MKLFGKRDKDPSGDEPRPDPRSTYAVAPLPRHAGPPASSTPLADQLARGGPGVTSGYVVVPRSLAEQMPLPWQRQLASVLAQFQHTHRQLSWPVYRVLPSREERLVDLDEEQLAEAGYVVELDVHGELVYRERSGRKVDDPESKSVLVTCLDPVVSARPAPGQPPTPPSGTPAPGAVREPAPMNIGPQPVWNVVPAKAHPAEPELRPPPPPAAAAPPSAAAAPPPPPAPEADQQTPPRGIPRPEADPIDWFAEPPDDSPDDRAEEGGFGPSGEPIERPYRGYT